MNNNDLRRRKKSKLGLFRCPECGKTYETFQHNGKFFIYYDWVVFGTKKKLCPKCSMDDNFTERKMP